MAYLIVKVPEGVIVNHHVGGHETFKPPESHIEIIYDGDFDIGWLWDGAKAVNPNPPPPVPTRIDGEVL